MKIMWRTVPILVLWLVISLASACAKREPVSHFVILPGAGRDQILESETERLKAVLDGVGARCHMNMIKSGQAYIIRYYQPNSKYEIGFFAKRTPTALIVYAEPMTPSVAGTETYREFRQNLANVLAAAFPGQVKIEKQTGD